MNTCKSTVAFILIFSFIAIFLSLTHIVSGEEHVVSSSLVATEQLASNELANVQAASPCSLNQDFKFSKANEYVVAMECLVGPEFNQFQMNYSTGGVGASVYFLSDSQYTAFTEKVNSNPAYDPFEPGNCLFFFYFPNLGYTSSKGTIVTRPRSDLGKVRVLVKKNPGFKATSSVYINLQMIPQQDNTLAIVVAVSSVGGVLGLLCCVGCCAGLIFCIVRRRKASYQQVV